MNQIQHHLMNQTFLRKTSLFLTFFCVSLCVAGQNNNWLGTSSADWNDANNWSLGMPLAAHNAIIPAGTPNAPIIMNGMIQVQSVDIKANAMLTIDGPATLKIDGSTSHGINSSGTLINGGTIDIGSDTGAPTIGGSGIRSQNGSVDNTGTISINHVTSAAIANINDSFNNSGTITIGDIGGIAFHGIRNQAVFENTGTIEISNAGGNGILCDGASHFTNISGELNVNASSNNGIWNKGTFINNARMITGGSGLTYAGFLNEDILINGVCAFVWQFDILNNTGNFTNDGYWSLRSLSPSSSAGNIVNNGILEDRIGSVSSSNITNNGLIIAPVITTNPASVPNALQIGNSSLFTIDVTVYTDFSLSTIAGTYDAANNVFTPSPNLTFGLNTVVFLITDINNFCTRAIILTIDNQECVSACSAGIDKCWTGNISDFWFEPSNWCPVGVPTNGESVELPDGAIVTYTFSDSDTIGRLVIMADAQLTIESGRTFSIENDPACGFCIMITNFGTVINRGNIELSQGQTHGLLTRGTFDNYGSILIDGSALRTNGFSGLVNQGIFNNHPNASLEIMNANDAGFTNEFFSPTLNVFTNFSDASISVHDVQGVGLTIGEDSFFENQQGGIIDIFNISSPSDKVDIQLGAEVLWNPSVDVR